MLTNLELKLKYKQHKMEGERTRQTSLSLEELLNQLRQPMQSLPRCFLINEVGEIYNSDDESSFEAEAILRELLESGDNQDEIYAFCWLSIKTNPSQETSSLVEKFKQNPENEEMLEMAQVVIENYLATHGKNNTKGD